MEKHSIKKALKSWAQYANLQQEHEIDLSMFNKALKELFETKGLFRKEEIRTAITELVGDKAKGFTDTHVGEIAEKYAQRAEHVFDYLNAVN